MGAQLYAAGSRALVGALDALRAIWRVLRWPVAIAGLFATIAVEALVVIVIAFPLDPAELRATGTPSEAVHWVPLAEVPSVAVAALLESEDGGFWDHRGVDGRALLRAAWLDVQRGKTAFGGSTITMQVARLAYTQRQPRGFGRKLREAVQALRIERVMGKREILEQWLNRAYFGNGAWGIDAAAHTYFGKPAAALSTGEVVLLVCLPRAPTAYDPIAHPGAARVRRDRVLARMVRHGLLAADEADRARAQPLLIRGGA